MGNPLSYYNGSTYTFTWADGRRLVSATKGSTNFSFTYNDEGIRTSKTVDGVKHTYVLDGSRIVSEQCGNVFIVYLYDENGNLVMRQTELSVKPKYFEWKKPEFCVECEAGADGVWISVYSDVFAKNVELSWKEYDLILSDNYFDITSTDPVRVFAKTDLLPEQVKSGLLLRSVYDIPLAKI